MPATIAVGQSILATAFETDASGVEVPIAVPGALSWSPSDLSIVSQATNEDGTATFVGLVAGTVSIAVLDTTNNLSNSDTLTVVAVPVVATAIGIRWGTPQ